MDEESLELIEENNTSNLSHNFFDLFKGRDVVLSDRDRYMIYQAITVLLFFYTNLFTIFLALYVGVKIKPIHLTPPIQHRDLMFFLRNLCFLVFALEFDSCASYLVTYINKRKDLEEPQQDVIYEFVFSLMPWWTKTIFNDVFPGLDQYMIATFFWLYLGLLRRFEPFKFRVMVWGGIFCRSIAILRFIRVMGYSSIILPSAKPGCVEERFVFPEDPVDFIIQMIKPRFTGGCNDLLVTGHGTVGFTVIFLLAEGIGGWGVEIIWCMTPLVFINVMMERHHYSTDILFGLTFSKFMFDRTCLMAEKKYGLTTKLKSDDDRNEKSKSKAI